MTQPALLNRRRLLQGAGLTAVALWVWGAPRLAGLRAGPLTFTDIPDAAPFRRLDRTGASSAGAAIFAGLDAAPPPFTGSLCAALFGANSGLSIAYFSDVNCPNCPAMEAATRRAVGQQAIPLIRHELPLLGPQSVIAARAILAAQMQGDAARVAERLIHLTGPLTPARMGAIAADTGLDAARWRADMESPQVISILSRNHGLARRLGIYGTPGTVIGRTVVLGALPEDQIAQIIALEQQAGPTCS